MKGFRFNICTRTNFPRSPVDKKNTSEQTLDFESIFWNNLLYLDQNLKKSVEYTTHCMMKIQQAIHQSSARTRSISRTTSIPTLGKLFQNNSTSLVTDKPMARSHSPIQQLQKAKSFCPQQQPLSPKRVPVHYSWNGAGTGSSSHNIHSGQNSSDTSLWSPKDEEGEEVEGNEKELLDTVSILSRCIIYSVVHSYFFFTRLK